MHFSTLILCYCAALKSDALLSGLALKTTKVPCFRIMRMIGWSLRWMLLILFTAAFLIPIIFKKEIDMLVWSFVFTVVLYPVVWFLISSFLAPSVAARSRSLAPVVVHSIHNHDVRP